MPKTIMIAEDDEGILDAMKLMLEMHGYNVVTTIDGTTILEMKDNLPDLLLLDIWMSGIDGRTICKQLKSQQETKNLPIIMISASNEVSASAKKAGADDFLAKPFDIDDLLAKVEKNIKD